MRGVASVALVLVLGAAACERNEACLPRFGDCSEDNYTQPDPVTACRDAATAFGSWYVRCGFSYQDGYNEIDPSCASCDTISGIDDINALYDVCLPWIWSQYTCDVPLDSSCVGQLLYNDYEDCTNTIDDNGDGNTDCLDPRCSCRNECSG